MQFAVWIRPCASENELSLTERISSSMQITWVNLGKNTVVLGVLKWKRTVMYRAVRIFGRGKYTQSKKAGYPPQESSPKVEYDKNIYVVDVLTCCRWMSISKFPGGELRGWCGLPLVPENGRLVAGAFDAGWRFAKYRKALCSTGMNEVKKIKAL
ncbi:hypothetical protein HAZ28_000004 [Salmonella enterica]|nr:hypothetical protein [Salmonella enterica subsp. enterica serovar Sandiego]EEK2577285.1 hypothetical protein [Salmonella enterica subsp. enterica serovar Montevideo]EEP1509668.1 hypothetical protein [Salmonella enterica]